MHEHEISVEKRRNLNPLFCNIAEEDEAAERALVGETFLPFKELAFLNLYCIEPPMCLLKIVLKLWCWRSVSVCYS